MDTARWQGNLDVLRRGLGAFIHRDVASLQETFHPDIVWHDQGRNQISGDYQGMGEVLSFLGTSFALAGDSVRFDPIAELTGEEYVAAVMNLHMSRGGRELDDRSLYLARIQDGKIAEVWAYAWDPYHVDAFWGDGS